jgi:phosphatidylglycerol:prolipoprotein diacylglycerol transferase
MTIYAALVIASYLAGIAIVAVQAKRDGRDRREIFDVLCVMAISAVVGSKAFHAIVEARGHELSTGVFANGPLALFLDDPWHGLRIFDPGYVFWGGLLTSTLCTYVFVRLQRIRTPLAYGNYAVPALALGIVVGRMGCFIEGCCYGIAGHPVQLYDAAFGVVALAYRRLTFVQFLCAYSLWRFGTEFFRADVDRGLWLWDLSTSQLICASVAIIIALGAVRPFR